MPQGAQVTRILVVDHAGNGFNILTTDDNETWLAFRRRPFNEAFRDMVLDRLQRDYPNAAVRWVNDFYGRIPEDWLQPGTRVL